MPKWNGEQSSRWRILCQAELTRGKPTWQTPVAQRFSCTGVATCYRHADEPLIAAKGLVVWIPPPAVTRADPRCFPAGAAVALLLPGAHPRQVNSTRQLGLRHTHIRRRGLASDMWPGDGFDRLSGDRFGRLRYVRYVAICPICGDMCDLWQTMSECGDTSHVSDMFDTCCDIFDISVYTSDMRGR